MQVEFSTKRLRQAFETEQQGVRQFGRVIGRKYAQRVKVLREANERNDLRSIPAFRFHEYKGASQGLFSIDLTGNWRLLVSFPTTTTVRIESVKDPHDR